MLRELWDYCTTPCPKSARKMGYLKESIAISARKNRQEKEWKSHLNNCKQEIRSSLIKCRSHNIAVILGGGLTYDLPIRFLSKTFKEVILVDLLFTKQALNETRRYNNISLIQADITGFVASVYNNPSVLPKTPDNEYINNIIKKASFVVSANIWSQLPPLLLRRLENYHSEDDLLKWSEDILMHHLEQLNLASGEVLLISDFEQGIFNLLENKTEINSLLPQINMPIWQKIWQWNIASAPEVDKDHDIYHTVGIAYKKEIAECLSKSME